MTTYSDLVTLLMCFFVLLFSMAKIDAKQFDLIATSLHEQFKQVAAGNILLNNRGKDIVKITNQYNPDTTGKQSVDNNKYIQENKTGTGESNKTSKTTSDDKKDKSQIKATATPLQTVTPNDQKSELENLKNNFNKVISTMNLDKHVKVIDNKETIILRIDSVVLFDSGKANLKNTGKNVLLKISTLFKTLNKEIIVNGHTDNLPIKSKEFPSNWELSTKRSTNVALFFIQNNIVDPKLITASGHGEYKPIATNKTPEGRDKNRRIDIEISK